MAHTSFKDLKDRVDSLIEETTRLNTELHGLQLAFYVVLDEIEDINKKLADNCGGSQCV